MEQQQQTRSKSIILYDKNGNWLGQVVITSDGFFAAVTEYGNFSYSWPSTGRKDFREFLLGLDPDYFGGKMFQGISYIVHSMKIREACVRFGKMILPALKDALIKDMNENAEF